MASILGSIVPIARGGSLTRTALELIYKNNAILLNDGIGLGMRGIDETFGTKLASSAVGQIASKLDKSVPLPLLGFVYDNPSSMEILKYSYSEYPYLNKSLIVNSYLKENTRFTVKAYKAITPLNTIALNTVTNEQIYSQLKSYCDYGGTFKLLTLWGTFNNLVLEGLNGIYPENNQVGGTGFEFNFLKPNIDNSGKGVSFSGLISSLTNGFF